MKFERSTEKDNLLKESRGIGFEDILEALTWGGLIKDIPHWNQEKYKGQRVLVIIKEGTVYNVPYKKMQNDTVRLITIYPSRKSKKLYLQ